ncbi:MAG: energy transducer TonB [Myxococcota bacterium]
MRRPRSLGLKEFPRRIGTVVGLCLLLASLSGCVQTFWGHIQERERLYALESARIRTERGQCVKALAALDHAEAKLDLGGYAREATAARVRCYEKLNRWELSAAHRRLLTDFYTAEPMALPKKNGSSVFRIDGLVPENYQAPPTWLKIESPRYSEFARRAKIVGRVIVSFRLTKNGRPKRIRVLEMPHPLLASWAIEAIGRSKPVKKKEVTDAPGGQYISTFRFEWRWAD